MANEFLLKEYDACFEQLRFYDRRHTESLRYIVSLGSGVLTVQLALYGHVGTVSTTFYGYQATLCSVVCVGCVLLFAAMVRNRVYFALMARQINSVRAYLMATAAPDFHDNQLYVSTRVPLLSFSSTQLLELTGAALIPAAFGGGAVFAAGGVRGCAIDACAVAGGVTGVVMWAVLVTSAVVYLVRRDANGSTAAAKKE